MHNVENANSAGFLVSYSQHSIVLVIIFLMIQLLDETGFSSKKNQDGTTILLLLLH